MVSSSRPGDHGQWRCRLHRGRVHLVREPAAQSPGRRRRCFGDADLRLRAERRRDQHHHGSSLAVTADGHAVRGREVHDRGGQPRQNLAAVDAATGALATCNPGADLTVDAILASGGAVYVGGTFDNIGGQARRRLAAVDSVSGAATAWNPSPSTDVFALALNGNTPLRGRTVHQHRQPDPLVRGGFRLAVGSAHRLEPNARQQRVGDRRRRRRRLVGRQPFADQRRTGGVRGAGRALTPVKDRPDRSPAQ